MLLKKLFALAAIVFCSRAVCLAQPSNDYSANWKKVEAFEKQGLPKSAWDEVNIIYKKASKDNNEAQQVKASIYLVHYRNMIEEDSYSTNIFYVDTLLETARTPAKNILQSMQAEMLWQYLQDNRWKLYNRTKLAEEKSNDISTWSMDKLNATIASLYQLSLSGKEILKQTKISQYNPILIKGTNTENLRPTLYDFLAFRALDYFENDESDVSKLAYQFTLNEPRIYEPAGSFAQETFTTQDTASLHYKALLTFQELLHFHLNDSTPDALLDADLLRLNFINQYAVLEDKDKLFEATLLNIETKYSDNPYSAQAMYLRSKIYYDRGLEYSDSKNPDIQYELKRAKELCEKVVAKFPNSEGGINAANLILQIQYPSLNLKTELVNIPQQPFRTLVEYKNIPALYVRVIKTTHDELNRINDDNYELGWKSILALKPVLTQIVKLPDPGDFQQHATEIKIDPLDPGVYILLASLDKDFSLQKNIIAKQITYVSNISYISNNDKDYYVLNRENGLPYSNAQVQVWENIYNYKLSRYKAEKTEKYTTDKNGHFKFISSNAGNNSYLFQVKANNEELFMNDAENYYSEYNSYLDTAQAKPFTFLFSDRSIYRPGQTVYFKGIVVQKNKDANKSKALQGFQSHVILQDANEQKISDLIVTTNDFGSYGSFKLPEGLLNGEFSILDETTEESIPISVEEYKRPKFEVNIQKPAGSYRLNDSIKITGTAKAYAGNNIDGAQVSYKVVRKVNYPFWYFIPPFLSNKDVVMTNGITTTNEKGEFTITFKALPDESIDKKGQPIFSYEVSADVTDINGETRSSETTVKVAYQQLQLSINMPDKVISDSLKDFNISSKNLNGLYQKSFVHVSVNKVIAPDKIFRKRYWDVPDQFVMSKDEYYTYFPNDVYKDEDQLRNWPIGETIYDRSDSTAENTVLKFQHDELSAGWYKIIATTKDKDGEPVKDEKYFQVIDNNKSAGAIEFISKSNIVEPGNKIDYTIHTAFDSIWLIQSISRMNDNNNTDYLKIDSSSNADFKIPVSESDRGGISLNYVFVKNNRVYQGNEDYSIPWSNKDLQIKYETFRDKTLPGSNEKYTLKISGSKGEKVAAEVLASMYDASLDQFETQNWNSLDLWPTLLTEFNWSETNFTDVQSSEFNKWNIKYLTSKTRSYDKLIYFERNDEVAVFGYETKRKMDLTGAIYTVKASKFTPPKVVNDEVTKKEKVAVAFTLDSIVTRKQAQNTTNNVNVQIRKNFNETAFFYPNLKTDTDGNVSFSFTIPEALTQWKLMTLAHTKDLASGYVEKTVITQKPLMVQPNTPRFLRDGDRMEFSAKVVSMDTKELSGNVSLELLDATTNQTLNNLFKNNLSVQPFTVAAGQSAVVKFPIEIPEHFTSAILYRIIATTDNSTMGGASDGEEMALPVLTNRILVTESLPLNLRNTNHKEFKFDKLLHSGSATTLTNQSLTVEYTSNPVWYAVQALPYLMEYPYECAEQTFNRYYANTLASFITQSTPKIKAVFEKWKTTDTAALLSNLQKNEELKSVLLQETPWVLDAQNENQQKKNIALLFDLVRLSNEGNKTIDKLKDLQSSNGGFVWFKGGPDDRYITQYILTGIGHLRKLNALSDSAYQNIKPIVDLAILYLDKKLKEDYDNLIKYKIKLNQNNLDDNTIQYLYMRSFFNEYEITDASQKAFTYFLGQAKKYWLQNSKFMQAMIALALSRNNDPVTPKAIIKSLKENAIYKDEMGMYWETGGYYWYQAPVESQAMMIEAFNDIDKNATTLDDLKTWLLKQKQAQDWKTTKATAEACYALLISPANKTVMLNEEKNVIINLGLTTVSSTDNKTESGTGYFKKRIEGNKVTPGMGDIAVSVSGSPDSTASWGSVYWQYFENMDKITAAATPLQLIKKLFVEKNSDTGPLLVAVKEGDVVNIGDKIIVRIELKVDRDMEYVHMKDMRAACMEPVNVISQYKWQGGLGYYESTKDASSNFFFSWLPRGTYVFEYPMLVTHSGDFNNGITTIQCMYAPEFTSHSEGIRVIVK